MTTEILLPPAPHVIAGIEKMQEFYRGQPSLLGEGTQIILDVGCGEGRHARLLASLGYSVIGLEPDGRVLPHTGLMTSSQDVKRASIRYMTGSVDDPELDNIAFVGVLCNEVVQLLHGAGRNHLMNRIMAIPDSGGINFVSAYVGSLGNGTPMKPVPKGYLRRFYDRAGWDIISSVDEPYRERTFGHTTVVDSISYVIAVKP